MKAYFFILCAVLLVSAEVPSRGSPAYENDNNALNYALTLENLEAAYYNHALTRLTEQDFCDAGYNSTVYDFLMVIRDHENAHVAALNAALAGRNATVVQPCHYNFPANSTVVEFLHLAAVFEATGTSAYIGAIDTITDSSLLTYAATIATVEARHSAFLNAIIGGNPFPNVTDSVLEPAEVAAIIAPFLASCPCELALPVQADTFRGQTYLGTVYNATDSGAYLNDNIVLNYALTLENLEAAFYNGYLANKTQQDFANAGIPENLYAWITVIRDHENAHVAALNMVLSSRGATPVAPCVYNFDFSASIETFLQIAAVLENTGVSAYTGAADSLSNEGLLTYAASIATVEARHAAFLNVLNNVSPFPNVTDIPLEPAQVVAAASGFIVSCPVDIVLPVPADNFRPDGQNSNTGNDGNTGSTSAQNTGVNTGVTSSTSSNTGDNTGVASSTSSSQTGQTSNTGDNTGVNTGVNTGDASTNTADNTGVSTGVNTGDNTGVNTGVNTGDNTGVNTGDASTSNTGDNTGVVVSGSSSQTGQTGQSSNTGDNTGVNTGDNTGVNTGDASTSDDQSSASGSGVVVVSGDANSGTSSDSNSGSTSDNTGTVVVATTSNFVPASGSINAEESSAVVAAVSATLLCLAMLV